MCRLSHSQRFGSDGGQDDGDAEETLAGAAPSADHAKAAEPEAEVPSRGRKRQRAAATEERPVEAHTAVARALAPAATAEAHAAIVRSLPPAAAPELPEMAHVAVVRPWTDDPILAYIMPPELHPTSSALPKVPMFPDSAGPAAARGRRASENPPRPRRGRKTKGLEHSS